MGQVLLILFYFLTKSENETLLSLPSTNRFLIYGEEERNLKLTGWDNSTQLSHSKAAFVKPYFAFMACGSWLTRPLLQCGAGCGLPREEAPLGLRARLHPGREHLGSGGEGHQGPWLDKGKAGEGYPTPGPQPYTTFGSRAPRDHYVSTTTGPN